jgi:hypothetical protein
MYTTRPVSSFKWKEAGGLLSAPPSAADSPGIFDFWRQVEVSKCRYKTYIHLILVNFCPNSSKLCSSFPNFEMLSHYHLVSVFPLRGLLKCIYTFYSHRWVLFRSERATAPAAETPLTPGFATGFLPDTVKPSFLPTGLVFCLPVTDLVWWSEHMEYRLLTGFVLLTSSKYLVLTCFWVSYPESKWVKFGLKRN